MPLSELISIASGIVSGASRGINLFQVIKSGKFLSRKIPLDLAAQKLWELIEKQEESKGKSSAGYRDPKKTLEMCVQYFLSAELVYGEVPPSRRMVKVDEEKQNVWSNGSDSNLYDLSGNILYENAFLYKRALKKYLKNFKY